MQLREWKRFLAELPELPTLVDRVSAPKSKPVFVIGSALSLPENEGHPGVPGVSAVIELVRKRVRKEKPDVNQLQRQLDQAESDGAFTYDAAFRFLRQRRGLDIVNEVVRDAILCARAPSARRLNDDMALEQIPIAGQSRAVRVPSECCWRGSLSGIPGRYYIRHLAPAIATW